MGVRVDYLEFWVGSGVIEKSYLSKGLKLGFCMSCKLGFDGYV